MTDTATRTGLLAGRTVEELLATTDAVIREQDRRDYVYEPPLNDEGLTPCRYLDDRGAPSCLIGHVLYRWGVPAGTLAEADLANGGTSAWTLLAALGADANVTIVADTIQATQDAGHTWGKALEAGMIARDRDTYVAVN